METASFPILRSLHFNDNKICSTEPFYKNPRNNLHSPTIFPLTPLKNSSFRCKKLQFNNEFKIFSSQSGSSGDVPSQQLAVLLEVEGVLMDVYSLGNRQAFNIAFRKLGLDCANWTEPVYLDLQRRSSSDEERMLVIYFNRIGWPTSVPTNENGIFVKSVLLEKKNALDDLVMSKALPLRPGVEDFIDDACTEGVPVVLLTAYCRTGEKVARSIIEKLGYDRVSKIKIIGNVEVEQSLYGILVFGKGVSSSLDEQLAKEVAKSASAEKQRIAEEVASMLKLTVDVDTSSTERCFKQLGSPGVKHHIHFNQLLIIQGATTKSIFESRTFDIFLNLQYIVATLRAGAEYAEVPLYNCVLVAGSQSGVAGAERIGMPCIVLSSSLTARAEFPSANAVMDGFGGADLTISRLRKKRWS